MALIERENVWELVGGFAETVRPGSKLEGVIKRYANAIDNAPTIDAIPVEWLREKMRGYASALKSTELSAIVRVMQMWQEEQEAR